jgi:hypothetical protein
MAEVSLNIRGRDDGAGKTLDSLRDKVKALGAEAGKVTSVRKVVNEDYDVKKDSVRQDFKDIRNSNRADYEEDKKKYERGDLNAKEWQKSQENFIKNNKELDSQEKAEIRDLQIEQNATLRELLDEFRQQNDNTEERQQRDNDEFDNGGSGSVSGDDDSKGGKGSKGGSGSGSTSDEDDEDDEDGAKSKDNQGTGQFGAGLRQATLGVARGDVSSTMQGGIEMAGGMIGGKAGAALGVAGLVAMLVKEFAANGEKIQEAIGQTSAMRGARGGDADRNNKFFQSQISGISGDDSLGKLGLDSEKFAEIINQKALASKIAGGDVMGRAKDDYAFNKGFGADVGMFSQFERFTKNQEDATTIGLDVLNTLTSIDKSSLKEGDLSTLSEKLASQQTIMSLQRSKRDIVDNDAALQILSAFEKIGLSDKGEKGGDFLSQTIQGLGEGGSENAMLLKYEAAKRANPDLANDPAALRRKVKFNSDDPKYMKESMKLMGEVSGGSDMALEDILYTMFPNLNEKDLEMYKKAAGGDKGFIDSLSGIGIDKSRKGTLNKETMYEDAKSSVGEVQTLTKDFGNMTQELFVNLKSLFTGDGIKISNFPKQPAPKNTTRK